MTVALPKPWREFTVPLYTGKVFIYRNRTKFKKAIDAHNNKIDEDDLCYGRCVELYKTGVKHYVIGWFDGNRSTLVHELGHLAIFALLNAGMAIADSNGEAYCYLLQHLYEETV